MTRHSIARPSGKQWQTLTRRQLFACATKSYVDWRTIQYELRWARHIEPSESGTPRPCSPQLMRYTRQRVLLRIRPRLPQAQHSFSQVSHSIPLRLMSPFSPGRENHDACLPGVGHRWRVGRSRPALYFIGFSSLFSNPPVAELSLYLVIFGLLTLLL